MCPVDALPEDFDNRQRGDWANIWPLSLIKPSWTAFGPRSKTLGCCWREMPITLFALFGPGDSRWEESNGLFALRSVNKPIFFYKPGKIYLSTIQYWCDWHVRVAWPLFFDFHWNTKTRTYYFRIGARRNADRFYDFPSCHWGGWN